MNQGRIVTRTIKPVLLSALLLGSSGAYAQTGGAFDLSWSSIDAGGQIAQGGNFKLASVIGQPESGNPSGGVFSLTPGFLQTADLFPVPVTLSSFSLD